MTKDRLAFRSDGTFTIAQFTDLHWQNGEEEDQRTYELMEHILQGEMPDLVVFTGDVIYSEGCKNPRQSFLKAVSVVEDNHIPWAVVFGNHDDEAGITREELMRIATDSKACVAEAGPSETNGVGNYVLEIQSSKHGKAAAALYCLDSGSYAQHIEGYDWIHHSQIGWYREQSKRLTNLNGGQPLPSLAFFHIPIPEYKEVWDYHTCYGDKFEGVCCANVNSGLFASMVEMGDVQGVFVGHDHINDYEGQLKGIKLCYGRATGYHTYGKEGFSRGVRFIQLKENTISFITWIHLDDGTIIVEPKEHLAEQMQK